MGLWGCAHIFVLIFLAMVKCVFAGVFEKRVVVVVVWWSVSGKKCGKRGERTCTFQGARNRHFWQLYFSIGWGGFPYSRMDWMKEARLRIIR